MLTIFSHAAAIAKTRQQFALAEEAIEHLPRRCREILRLAAFERLPPREIAARLGLAESTVYVQLARGFCLPRNQISKTSQNRNKLFHDAMTVDHASSLNNTAL